MERCDAATSRVEEEHYFDPFVGSSSGGLDKLMSPPIAINLNRYNSVDGRL